MSSLENFISLLLANQASLWVLIVTAVACALIGAFLVLRQLSMVSDAISHSVLLGIVLAFFITGDLRSPLLIVGAASFGLLMVWLTELLAQSPYIKGDDAVGIIYPFFFALAVILITRYAGNVHLDTDMVLMGEVILAPLNTISVFNFEMPKALFEMGILIVLNLAFIVIFFKELKITTFDKQFAHIAGFSAGILSYSLMALCSLTTVVAFDAVGAILVVSFLIAPGASAYLIAKDLKVMLALSAGYGVMNAVLGYVLSLYFNVSMSGMTATVAGLTFLLTFLLNRKGLITSLVLAYSQRKEIKRAILLQGVKSSQSINPALPTEQVDYLVQAGYITAEAGGKYRLKGQGRDYLADLERKYGIS
ncbi:metal ABC transporter permease [Aerococcus sanguinicola]|uniref:Metal ABC transporter n=1 Tax=Aerococcus sanguinicola TaxID=119206 RepID=A0A0X8FAH8_9LACT|nr:MULTISPECIES: metal ABC transporter permease [Aerococcus]AMB93764.1 metal ABC transporter [Aerococcus sanguinicola]MDK7050385.1 metal ABC transporter permease [Aerococcus sanguinicola]OFT94770.1 metal ABC transporter [Aerococcus sp. HMSC23C02]PKZ21505.1 metal ABC transporter permease [Aerococcus sanguinicola]